MDQRLEFVAEGFRVGLDTLSQSDRGAVGQRSDRGGLAPTGRIRCGDREVDGVGAQAHGPAHGVVGRLEIGVHPPRTSLLTAQLS